MMTDRSYKTENNVDSDVKHKHNNKRKQNYINELKKNKLEKKNIFLFDRVRTCATRDFIELCETLRLTH